MSKKLSVDYIVVDVTSAYNALIGQTTLNRFPAVVSTPHLCMKFSTMEGIATIKGDQKLACKCYNESLKFKRQPAEQKGDPATWSLYVGGSSNKSGNRAGVILESNQGTRIELSLRFEFPTSNNQVEYEALLAGLKLAKEVGAERLMVFSDLQVITSQINSTYQPKDPIIKKYLDEAREQLTHFAEGEVRHIAQDPMPELMPSPN
ncbi:uncharacterized protein [Arachis hypogaea]|uniref:uncharacterized protein n=1 Tax=Arachis hypogaea TaxID=3818 RepID=UPI003B224900